MADSNRCNAAGTSDALNAPGTLPLAPIILMSSVALSPNMVIESVADEVNLTSMKCPSRSGAAAQQEQYQQHGNGHTKQPQEQPACFTFLSLHPIPEIGNHRVHLRSLR